MLSQHFFFDLVLELFTQMQAIRAKNFGIFNVSVNTTILYKQINSTVLAFVQYVEVLLHVSTLSDSSSGSHYMNKYLVIGLIVNMDLDR
jgi:hypothetical protein